MTSKNDFDKQTGKLFNQDGTINAENVVLALKRQLCASGLTEEEAENAIRTAANEFIDAKERAKEKKQMGV
jgi:hypothetical protein